MKVRRWDVVAGLCLLKGYRMGAEIGVAGGKFTTYLCSVMPTMKMVAVDLWQVLPDRDEPGSETYETWQLDRMYTVFKDHCDKFFPDRVAIKRTSTIDAAKEVADGSLDFAFIDADHSYSGASGDIAAWGPKIRQGGMLCGHDYNWPTVKRAVDEIGTPDVFPDNVWVLWRE